MPLFALYLIKLSISLSAAWLFYQLFLRRLTFYSWNRWYLLGYSLLSFFIPLINVARVIQSDPGQEATVIKYIPVIGNYKPPVLGTWDLIFWGLALGALFLLVRLLSRWLSLRRIRRQARLLSDEGEMLIYQVDEPIIPFSFGNAVYINATQHTEKEWSAIILHEYIHIRQRHTLDILVAELCCALNWYNPFAWLIRHAIRQNLEFIADSKVLEKGLDKKGYQYHLLKVIGEPRYRLANNFNFSSLKKRIIMMNKIRSARLQLAKFLFLLPLFAVLLVAFRSQLKNAAAGAARTKAPQTAAGQQSPTAAAPVQEQQTTATLHEAATLHTRATFLPGTSPQEGATITHAHAPRPGDSRISQGGSVAAAGAKEVGTKEGRTTDTVPSRVHTGRDTMASLLITRLNLTAPDKHEPLYIVDDKETMEGMKGIKPDEISHISVLKDKSAVAKYGSKAIDGVVLIYTKAYVAIHPEIAPGVTSVTITKDNLKGDSARLSDDHMKVASESGVSIRLKDPFKGLVILDGEEISGAVLSKLDPTKIGSMEVFKGEEATKKYGDKGKDGVILITSKK
jgi:TonB-dependent SusC/RagA subfamily outer membrane receptor